MAGFCLFNHYLGVKGRCDKVFVSFEALTLPSNLITATVSTSWQLVRENLLIPPRCCSSCGLWNQLIRTTNTVKPKVEGSAEGHNSWEMVLNNYDVHFPQVSNYWWIINAQVQHGSESGHFQQIMLLMLLCSKAVQRLWVKIWLFELHYSPQPSTYSCFVRLYAAPPSPLII